MTDLTQSTLNLDPWPYLTVLERLGLALALGLFVGLERERRHKEAGMRTFAFSALLGGLGGLLGESYGLMAIFLLGVLTVILNVQSLRVAEKTELTTSAALLVTGFAGILAGMGHTLSPSAVAVTAAALLAWKRPLSGFSAGLSETELRSAIMLAIFGFVIYPALPAGRIGPWELVDLRTAWITVILISGIGFINYILGNLYGGRGVELAGFLGGVVNSTVTVHELAKRSSETKGKISDTAFRGIILADAAMVLRNGVLLLLLAPQTLMYAALAFALMLIASLVAIFPSRLRPRVHGKAPKLHLKSPFSLGSALRYGFLFLLLQMAATLAQRTFGAAGLYITSALGGLFSSASAVAVAASLAANGTVSPSSAGISAVIASVTSVLVNIPLMMRTADPQLVKRLRLPLFTILALGILGAILQTTLIGD